MPNCRNCGTRLTKFDNDICPVCGCKHPLEGMTSETVEITSEISAVGDQIKGFEQKSRSVCFVLSLIVGWSGAAFFYQHKIKKGILWLVLNIVLFAGIFCVLFFPFSLGWVSYLSAIIALYVLNIGMAFFFLYAHDYRDGRGNFLK